MDPDGVWCSPHEWPEDTPPLDGWVRDEDGRWDVPSGAVFNHQARTQTATSVHRDTTAENVESTTPRVSADRKAMLLVAGVILGAVGLLGAALLLITQAGAEDIPEGDAVAEVLFPAQTNDDARLEERRALAEEAPDLARERLAELAVRADTNALDSFNRSDWIAEATDCLDITEKVLVERSDRPVVWADNLECVPDAGRWSDPYLNVTIMRTLDAEVNPRVPPAIAHVSGAADWTDETRHAYVTDTSHPATLEITRKNSGHNPRSQDPSMWKPSREQTWCAYSIDWIAVKDRWQLSVTERESGALAEMLDSCDDPTSSGPNLDTVTLTAVIPPTIERIGDVAE